MFQGADLEKYVVGAKMLANSKHFLSVFSINQFIFFQQIFSTRGAPALPTLPQICLCFVCNTLYHVTTESTCPIWTGSSVSEQIPAKDIARSFFSYGFCHPAFTTLGIISYLLFTTQYIILIIFSYCVDNNTMFTNMLF